MSDTEYEVVHPGDFLDNFIYVNNTKLIRLNNVYSRSPKRDDTLVTKIQTFFY